jgi:hypothetical protein
MADEIKIREFSPDDAVAVREMLFRVKPSIGATGSEDAFELCIARTL